MERKTIALVVALSVLLLVSAPALALDSLVDSVAKGCKKELTTYCKDVTPGEGRILACLYAHGDKLSNRCEYALYDAAAQLERAVAALTYMANECREDLKKFCSDVKPGQGRLINCIDKNKGNLSERCKQAIADVGVKK